MTISLSGAELMVLKSQKRTLRQFVAASVWGCMLFFGFVGHTTSHRIGWKQKIWEVRAPCVLAGNGPQFLATLRGNSSKGQCDVKQILKQQKMLPIHVNI